MDVKELFEGLVIEDYAEKQKEVLESKQKNEELLKAYNTIVKTPDGKRIIWDIMSFCGLFQLSMTGNSYTYFNEGKRHVGLYLLTMLKLGGSIDDIDRIEKINPDG